METQTSDSKIPDVEDTPLILVNGKVKELRVDWGFIEGEDGKDYFFYCKSMDKTSCAFRALKVNDIVKFVATETAKGPRAERIIRLVSLSEKASN